MAAAVQLSNSLNPTPRRRRRMERYTPPLPPAPPESPFVDSACHEPLVQSTAPVLVTQHSQLWTASSEAQTVRIGQNDDPNYESPFRSEP